jgi:hypothetical protein
MTPAIDLAAAEEWIRATIQPAGKLVLERERSWATIVRVPLADGQAWFKACAPV